MTSFGIVLRAFAYAVCGVVLGSGALRGMSVRPPSFSELVGTAEQIAEVTIVGSRCQWDRAPNGQAVIHTYVACRRVRAVKGSVPATFELRFLGGRVGGTQLDVPDMPVLEVGGTYVLFVAGNGHAVCPLAGVGHGCYRVRHDPQTGREQVWRQDGEPLHALSEITAPRRAAMGGNAGSGMALDDFIRAISDERDRQFAHAK